MLLTLSDDGICADDLRLEMFLDTYLERGAACDRYDDARDAVRFEFNPADDPSVGYYAPLEDLRTDAQRENDALLASCPPEHTEPVDVDTVELDGGWGEIGAGMTKNEIGALADTNLWLSREYSLQGATRLAEECAEAAEALYDRWAVIVLQEMGVH